MVLYLQQLALCGTLFLTARAATMREALLCEARLRIASWYLDTNALDWPKERDGVVLQISKEGLPCGGDNIPVTFGHFEIQDAAAEDVVNALSDTDAQQHWDGLVGSVTQLGDWPCEQAQGLAMTYVAHPFADREVYEWEAINTTDPNEMWVVFSTEANVPLHNKKDREGGSVAAQDCLAAYRVQKTASGSINVTFTSQVNSHPWLLSASFVFNILWGKTVDYVENLRLRSKALAQARGSAPPSIVKPSWMTKDVPEDQIQKGCPAVDLPFERCWSAPKTATAAAQKWEALQAELEPMKLPGQGLNAAVLLSAGLVAFVFIGFFVRRRQRTSQGFIHVNEEEPFGLVREAQPFIE